MVGTAAVLLALASFACRAGASPRPIQPSTAFPPLRLPASSTHEPVPPTGGTAPSGPNSLLPPSGTQADPTPPQTELDVVSGMLARIDSAQVRADLRRLTGEVPVCTEGGCHTISHRLTGSQELGWAKDYVGRELSQLGYSVERQDWSRSEHSDQNLIVTKPGASVPEDAIYLVAHLDGAKKLWTGDFPGADDDASGVVDLLQVARILRGYSLDRTVVFFFSTGEEQGRLGTRSYLEQLNPKELSRIKYVIDLDMLGYDSNQDGAMELWYGGQVDSLALAESMRDAIQKHQLQLVPEFVVGCG